MAGAVLLAQHRTPTQLEGGVDTDEPATAALSHCSGLYRSLRTLGSKAEGFVFKEPLRAGASRARLGEAGSGEARPSRVWRGGVWRGTAG